MEGHASIARRRARQLRRRRGARGRGRAGLVDSALRRHEGVRIAETRRDVVELHLAARVGRRRARRSARQVQERVADYLARMADLDAASVDVVVDEIGAPPAKP